MDNEKIVFRLERKLGELFSEIDENPRNYTSVEVFEMLLEISEGFGEKRETREERL